MNTRDENPKNGQPLTRRDALKSIGAVAADLAAAAVPPALAADAPSNPSEEKNPYGSPPGTGISMPPYYRPTPSIKNRNNYFPQSEELGADEMRITFMGSNPFPPRLSQAGTCIMVDRKSTRLNSSHSRASRMPSSA